MNIEKGRELYPIGIVGENMTWSCHKRKTKLKKKKGRKMTCIKRGYLELGRRNFTISCMYKKLSPTH